MSQPEGRPPGHQLRLDTESLLQAAQRAGKVTRPIVLPSSTRLHYDPAANSCWPGRLRSFSLKMPQALLKHRLPLLGDS
jgi:hypothetical protein